MEATRGKHLSKPLPCRACSDKALPTRKTSGKDQRKTNQHLHTLIVASDMCIVCSYMQAKRAITYAAACEHTHTTTEAACTGHLRKQVRGLGGVACETKAFCVSIHPSIHPSKHLFTYLPTYSICLSICQSIYQKMLKVQNSKKSKQLLQL